MVLGIRQAVGVVVLVRGRKGFTIIVKKIKRQDLGKKEIASFEWDISKGGVKEGEILETALLRELFEELGSKKFKIIEKLPFEINFNFPKGLSTKYSSQQTKLFLVEYFGDGTDLVPDNSEIGEILILPIADAIGKASFKETRAVLAKL